MHKIDGFFPFVSGRKVRRLDFRVPEDRMISDDRIGRSPAVNEWIEAYFSADGDDDDHGRSTALRGVIDSNRADHSAAGLPVYAHPPLPEDFAEELLRSHSQTSLNRLLAKFEPSVRPQIAEQLAVQASPRRGFAAPARNADDQSGLQQQFASGIEGQVEDTPSYGARGVGQRLQPFALMGGNEDDGGGAPQAPRGPQRPPPPTPRPHPDSEQRENDRRARHAADCVRDYDDFIRIDKAIEQYHNDKVRYESELNSLEILRGDLIWRRQRTLEDLSTARSRSTSSFWHLECRTHLPIPGRKTKINIGKDIFCEIVKKGVTDKLEEQERWRLEEQKAKDIERLGNQLKNLETRIADTEMQIAAKKGQIQGANEALGNLGMGEKRVRDQYNARGCRRGARDWGA